MFFLFYFIGVANKRTYIYSACQPAELNAYPVKSLLHLDHMGDAYSFGGPNGVIVKIVSAFPFELSALSLELLYCFELLILHPTAESDF